MIPLLHLWQGHSGALRRKKIDTPSLVGCCTVTQVTVCEPYETAQPPFGLVIRQQPRLLLSNPDCEAIARPSWLS